MAVRARYGCVWTAAAARSAPFASHVPVDKIQNDAHPFIIDAQVVLQVLNELGACQVGIRKHRLVADLARNEPLLFDPRLERFMFELGANTEFLPAMSAMPR